MKNDNKNFYCCPRYQGYVDKTKQIINPEVPFMLEVDHKHFISLYKICF